jgi:hypothetical protein
MDKPIPEAVQISDEMVERACKRYAFREDGATFPDDYSEYEVLAERKLMRDFLTHVLAERLTAAQQQGQAVELIRFDYTNGDGRPDSKIITHDEMRERYARLREQKAVPMPDAQPMQQGGGEVRPFAWYRPRQDSDQEPEFRTSEPPTGHGWLPVPGTAPPSAPVGVGGFKPRAVAFVGSDGNPAWINPEWPDVPREPKAPLYSEAEVMRALAQQPAAVDEDALRRALAEYPGKNTHQLQAAKVCAGVVALAATFATQHQEPKP